MCPNVFLFVSGWYCLGRFRGYLKFLIGSEVCEKEAFSECVLSGFVSNWTKWFVDVIVSSICRLDTMKVLWHLFVQGDKDFDKRTILLDRYIPVEDDLHLKIIIEGASICNTNDWMMMLSFSVSWDISNSNTLMMKIEFFGIWIWATGFGLSRY